MIPVISGLSEIASQYDGFILDLWGVLHDGTEADPGAAHALGELKRFGKRVLLLSNAPRPAQPLVEQMAAMGIGPELYDFLLTSGEATFGFLGCRDRSISGQRLYHMGPAHDESVFAGLGLETVGLEQADFILNTGPWGDETVEDFLPVLTRAAGLGLPMICANPDLWVVRQGQMMPCAGLLAARYEEMGGYVLRFGKPDPAIYAQALGQLGTAPARTLCIGDSMATDITGAVNAGLESLLVGRGIHADDLGVPPQLDRVEALVARYGLKPHGVVSSFVW